MNARSDVGASRVGSPGGRLVRLLLPGAMVGPPLLGWLLVVGERAGWYGTEAGATLFAASNVLFFVALILGTAHWINRADRRRRRAEDDLRDVTKLAFEQAAYLAEIVRASDDVIIGKTLDGTIKSWNASAEMVYGYSAAEAIGHHISMLVPPGAPHDVTEMLRQVAEGKVLRGLETVRVRKDGSLVDMSLTLSPIHDATNQVVGVSTIARDISGRKQAEAALRSAALFNQQIVQSLTEGLAVYDRNLRFIVFNPEMERLTGWRAENVIGAHPGEFIPDFETYPLMNVLQRALAGESVHRDEVELLPPLIQHERWVTDDHVPLKTPAGEIVGVITIFRDITARKLIESEQRRAEQTLRALQNRTAFALEAAGIGVWELDPATNQVSWSGAHAVLFGLDLDECSGVGGDPVPSVYADDRKLLKQAIERAVHAGQLDHEFRATWTDGTTHQLRTIGRMSDSGGGGAARLIGVTMDVTAQRMLEAQFRQAQKMDAVGQLAGGIAHDFNNLLTAILGYGRFLEEVLTDAEQRRDLAEIIKAADRAAALTRQLLAFSRRQVLELTIVNVNALIEGTTNLLQRLIGEHIAMTTELDRQLRTVRADRGQLEQILMNLTVNARDAMPKGGTLQIATANVDLEAGSLPAPAIVKPGSYVMLAVSDNGIGMSDEVKARIFEPFFTTKDRDKGTGLGLSTVYGIVSQIDGYVTVDTALGRGTSFKVYLPCAEREAAAALAETAAGVKPQGGSEVILLVEDEASVRFLAHSILERAGYQVLDAGHPAEAHSVLERFGGDVDLSGHRPGHARRYRH